MSRRDSGAAILALSLLVRPASAEDRGRLVGFVEDTRGVPVAGAMIALFGKGLGAAGLVTFSDQEGRFALPVPAGSYTLRALAGRNLVALAQQITVLPNRESVFAVSLRTSEAHAAEEVEAVATESAATRELKWLLRHKRRSVLEERGGEAPEPVETGRLQPALLPLASGAFEVVATSMGETDDTDLPTGSGLLRLRGRFGESGHWNLGGLLAESETRAWRTAAEFSVQPGGGHQVQAGAGYGGRLQRAALPVTGDGTENRTAGAIFVEDHWDVGYGLTLGGGARYTFIGFLNSRNHLDPAVSLALRRDARTRIRASASSRTLTPGGDLLTLSTLASTPAIAYAVMDDGLAPEKLERYEIAVDRQVGRSTVSAHSFYERTRDQLANAFDQQSARALRISNAGQVGTRGLGLTVQRHAGPVSAAVTYTYGRGWREGNPAGLDRSFRQANFHDVVGRLEAMFDASGTRVRAFCRYNRLTPEEAPPASSTTRFDVQVVQGLPFTVTGTQWEVLVAYRNLFYESSEGGTLDEIAVVNPPRRVLGGISVKF